MRKLFQAIAPVLILLIIAAAGCEAILAFLLAHPQAASPGLRNLLRDIYSTSYRNILQMDMRFVRYDPLLKYTLRPGTFVFRNTELNNEFRVNSMGLRDDELSLSSPEIIVAGDSIPMGWGVNQDETYASLVEKMTGKRVLNAAVSSYSTVEAVRMLDRIVTENLKYLILFYQSWKFPENEKFYSIKNTTKP